jgi:hypothetical protein
LVVRHQNGAHRFGAPDVVTPASSVAPSSKIFFPITKQLENLDVMHI